jgi:hypothetical protein
VVEARLKVAHLGDRNRDEFVKNCPKCCPIHFFVKRIALLVLGGKVAQKIRAT